MSGFHTSCGIVNCDLIVPLSTNVRDGVRKVFKKKYGLQDKTQQIVKFVHGITDVIELVANIT